MRENKGEKMKKILLCMLILITLTGTLLSEELDMDRVMPKKLVYSELPEDYPKELDELFIFYWDTVHMMENWDERGLEAVSRIREYFDSIDITKRARIAYLQLWAANQYPEYFKEYIEINGYPKAVAGKGRITMDSLDSLSIYPPVQRENAKAKNGKWGPIQSILSIMDILRDSILDNHQYNSVFYSIDWPIWVRCRINDIEYVDRRSTHFCYLDVDVIESLGDRFKKSKLVLLVDMKKEPYMFKRRQEYLINIGYALLPGSYQGDLQPSNLDIGKQNRYMTHLNRIYEINSNNLSQILLTWMHPLGEREFEHVNQRITFDLVKEYYDNFLNRYRGIE